MPQISVLVPVCNVEAYLEQCLDSIISQTFQDFEIICIDDGSTDHSGQILDRYSDSNSRIKVIHKENTGYGNSMNIALDYATGEYISILESDDYAEPDMLQKLYNAASSNAVEVVKANYYNYYGDKDVYTNHIADYPKYVVINKYFHPTLFNLADTIWSCLYQRSFLLEHDIRFHETPGASYQDISFALQVWFYAEKVYFIEDAVLHYRRNNPGASMNNPAKLFCVFDEYEWIEERFKDDWKSHPVLDSYLIAAKYRDYFNHYRRVGVQYQYALLQRLKESFDGDQLKGRVQQVVFLPRVWQMLRDMNEDINAFFQKTAKQLADARLSICQFQNVNVYAKAFFKELQNYPQVLIYGAGQVGRRLAEAVINRGGQVDRFIVTRIVDDHKECMGIPIQEVREVSYLADTCAVVIAVAERMQYELYQNLKNYGFKNIFRADEVIRKI